jgi:hypothetical protein
MKIYLASRFGRQAEMKAIRDRLVAMDHVVTSRWLDAEKNDAVGSIHPPKERKKNAIDDYEDVIRADAMINFTEAPGGCGRGGRHVEFGIALQADKRLIVVGYRENVFHYLPPVEFYGTVEQMLGRLAQEAHCRA